MGPYAQISQSTSRPRDDTEISCRSMRTAPVYDEPFCSRRAYDNKHGGLAPASMPLVYPNPDTV